MVGKWVRTANLELGKTSYSSTKFVIIFYIFHD